MMATNPPKMNKHRDFHTNALYRSAMAPMEERVNEFLTYLGKEARNGLIFDHLYVIAPPPMISGTDGTQYREVPNIARSHSSIVSNTQSHSSPLMDMQIESNQEEYSL